MSTQLTPAERQRLKGRAHALDPVVMIGSAGLAPTVLAEIERALQVHELIKIRVAGDDRARRTALMDEICAATAAAPVQQIGKVLVIYRPRPQNAPPP
jgi:putative YhbY family RNA-binding protein